MEKIEILKKEIENLKNKVYSCDPDSKELWKYQQTLTTKRLELQQLEEDKETEIK